MTLMIISIFLIILLIIFISYKQSNRILKRKGQKNPLLILPSQFNAPYEDINFTAEEGLNLKGWFIPAEKSSDKTIVFLHGWGLNKGDLLERTIFLRQKGFNLFYFDFRGSGSSDCGPSSIGYFETKDAQSALDYICGKYPKQTKHLGIYGLSMGAAVAVYTAAHNKKIECILIEACYYSYEKVVARWVRKHKKVPYFPMVALLLFFVRKRLGLNPEDFCPKNNIEKIKKPLLIINGELDSLALPSDAKALFKAAISPKELWLVPGANHTECAAKAGPLYQQKLTEFFTKNLGA